MPQSIDTTKADAFEEMLDALWMVYDADEDCRRDNLPQIPAPAKAKIVRALLCAGRYSHRAGYGFFASSFDRSITPRRARKEKE